MKKIITLFFTLFVAYAANSQVLLSEDFETSFPSNFTLYDEDGNTVNSNIAGFFPNAWNRLIFSGTTDYFAASTSLYTPAGTSNDWMVTPALNLTSSSFYLIWEGRSANSNNFESYEVLISTTGNAVADFTTVLTTVTSETVEWNRRGVDLSAYANETVYIAFRNISTNKYILGIDDIEVKSVKSLDVGVSEVSISKLYKNNTDVTVEGVIENNGSTTITSVDVTYTAGNAAAVKQTFSGLNIAPFKTAAFTMNKKIKASGAGGYTNVLVEVSNPNGGTDLNAANDTLSKAFFVNTGTTVAKAALFEEFTTARCQFCPDGAVVADYIKDNISEAIVVGVHACFNTDGMTNIEASELCSTLGSGSAPAGMVDRVLFENEGDVAFSRGPLTSVPYTPATSAWTVRTNDRIALGAPVTVDIRGSYTNSSRKIDVDVTAFFADYVLPGKLSMSLMIVEDSVSQNPSSGYNADWDQINAYYASSGHPFQGVGTALPPPNQSISFINNYVHKHVLRDILPSTFGDTLVIPSNVVLWTDYSRNFTTTLPNSYKDDRVSLVAVVSYAGPDSDEYEVLNAKEYKLSELIAVGIAEEKNVSNTLKVYPNPSKDVTNISLDLAKNERVQLDIRDITGKVILTQDHGVMSRGNQLVRLDVSNLTNGFYFLNLKVGDEVVTRKITVAK